MKILVTGATGLVGARLLPRLAEDGHECRAIVRRENSVPREVTEVIGDLADSESPASAVNGVDAIVHLAAAFRTTNSDLPSECAAPGTGEQHRDTKPRKIHESSLISDSASPHLATPSWSLYEHHTPRRTP
ncbi:NAD-dependent epimerase/dehydratase family protein [Mycolicibacterium iranicum]|uniref:NAD-dependent epimerase/dehydratase family protein n=1 Tax=Mycolicibacterium iranicum TaxID=912594 RepID=UPI0009DB7A43|nr:NAD-dependent epimerase/dehydratase family protein [Mycolicibacterium iranicum]